MGVSLGFKRVSRVYGASIRRGLRDLATAGFLYSIGLVTGLYHNATPEFHERVTVAGIIVFLGFGAVLQVTNSLERRAVPAAAARGSPAANGAAPSPTGAPGGAARG